MSIDTARFTRIAAFALIGLAVKPLHFLYDYAWFVGFFMAGIVYVLLMKIPATSPRLSLAVEQTASN